MRRPLWWAAALALVAACTATPPSEPAPPPSADFRVASFNVKGGADTVAGSWRQRLPGVVATMREAGAQVYLLQEAERAGRHPRQILAELQRQTGHTSWALARGPDAVHAIFDSAVFDLTGQQVTDIGDARVYLELGLRHRATGVPVVVWTTHLIASGKGRPTPVAAQMRKVEAHRIAAQLGGVRNSIGGGDINSHYRGPGTLASIISEAGHTEVRDLVVSTANGHLDSNDDFLPNAEEGAWLDRLFAGPGCRVEAVGLVDSGDSSDHNLIWAQVSVGGAAGPAR